MAGDSLHMQPAPDTDLTFGKYDYAVFTVVLLLISVIGVLTGFRGIIRQAKAATGQKKSAVRARDVSLFPVSVSLASSLFSIPFLIGSPAAIYLHGSDYVFLTIGSFLGIAFATVFVFKRMYKLKLTSVYEYFELRFGMVVRVFGAIMFMLNMILILASSMYGPGLILSQVMKIPIEVAAILVGLLGMIYISIGGLRGVVWLDVLQMALILIFGISLFLTGLFKIGGAMTFDIAVGGGRLSVPKIDPDPRTRITVWTQIFGGAVTMASFFSTQTVLQKLLPLPSLKTATRGSLIGAMMSNIYIVTSCLVGVTMYAYNVLCDPFTTGKVNNPDQILPYFMLQVFSGAPGISGLFVAITIGSTLSNIGAGVNAMAALTMMNFINPLYTKKKGEDFFKTRPFIAAILFKIMSAIWAVIVVIGGYLASVINKELLQLFLSFVGLLHAPLFGIFILGIFFPFSNKWGAIVGSLSSVIFIVWIFLASIFSGMANRAGAPLYLVNSCPNNTHVTDFSSYQELLDTGLLTNNVQIEQPEELTGLQSLYSLSFMYYSLTTVLITIVVGNIVSFIADCCQKEKQYNTNPNLGYLWWLEPELPPPVTSDTEGITTQEKSKEPNPMQVIMQTDIKTFSQSMKKVTEDSENVKDKHKLKRTNTSQRALLQMRGSASDSSFETSPQPQPHPHPNGEAGQHPVVWTVEGQEDNVNNSNPGNADYFDPQLPSPNGVFYRL